MDLQVRLLAEECPKAILVLNLYHEDGPAVAEQQRLHAGQQLLPPGADKPHEHRVICAHVAHHVLSYTPTPNMSCLHLQLKILLDRTVR